jgi:hypothetical protein
MQVSKIFELVLIVAALDMAVPMLMSFLTVLMSMFIPTP